MEFYKKKGSTERLVEMFEKVNKVKIKINEDVNSKDYYFGDIINRAIQLNAQSGDNTSISDPQFEMERGRIEYNDLDLFIDDNINTITQFRAKYGDNPSPTDEEILKLISDFKQHQENKAEAAYDRSVGDYYGGDAPAGAYGTDDPTSDPHRKLRGESYKPNENYFNTFAEVLDQIREYANYLGFSVDEDELFSWQTGGVSYETTKEGNFQLYRDKEQEMHGRTGKPLNRNIIVSVYRMPSGKYELTIYKSW